MEYIHIRVYIFPKKTGAKITFNLDFLKTLYRKKQKVRRVPREENTLTT